MSEHTPKPWKAERADLNAIDEEDDRDETRWSVLTDWNNDRDYFIATIENGAPGDTLKTEEANAHLIAAAPEMLEVLREVALPPYHDSGLASLLETLRVRAESVIAKAENRGRQ